MLKGERGRLRAVKREEGRLRQHVWSNGQYIDLVSMGILRDEWQA